jgi:UDP:flavonoid glycosyltransferase YjiC (YdhE family)
MAARRIVLTTFGSFGDLHPYVAIARSLCARGHEAVLATTENYRAKVEALGIPFRAVRPDLADVVADPAFMRRVMHPRKGTEVVVRELTMPYVRETYEDLAAACGGADAVVGHPLTYTARLVAEKTGIRWASSALAPISMFSATDPSVMPTAPAFARFAFLGPWFHRAVFRLARRTVRSWCEPWHRLRAELGLPRTDDDPLFEGQHSPSLVLALFSSQLARPQPDWPQNTVVTGFPFFDEDGAADVAPDLARFLDGGPPPVVFTLGSSAVKDAGDFYDVGAEAARRLGRRAVLVVGRDAQAQGRSKEHHLRSGQVMKFGTSPSVAVCDYALYSRLFPRAAAIVHQGGVGTTGQALRSGRPMLVMPFAHDQFDNAARVTRRGVARTIARSAFAPARVARELDAILGDAACAARAAEVGRIVAAEDGAASAADAIERLLSS